MGLVVSPGFHLRVDRVLVALACIAAMIACRPDPAWDDGPRVPPGVTELVLSELPTYAHARGREFADDFVRYEVNELQHHRGTRWSAERDLEPSIDRLLDELRRAPLHDRLALLAWKAYESGRNRLRVETDELALQRLRVDLAALMEAHPELARLVDEVPPRAVDEIVERADLAAAELTALRRRYHRWLDAVTRCEGDVLENEASIAANLENARGNFLVSTGYLYMVLRRVGFATAPANRYDRLGSRHKRCPE